MPGIAPWSIPGMEPMPVPDISPESIFMPGMLPWLVAA